MNNTETHHSVKWPIPVGYMVRHTSYDWKYPWQAFLGAYAYNESDEAKALYTEDQVNKIIEQLKLDQAPRSYVTQSGESVAGIALRELRNESRWREIASLNSDRFPGITAPDYYPVGTVLVMPEVAVKPTPRKSLVADLDTIIPTWNVLTSFVNPKLITYITQCVEQAHGIEQTKIEPPWL